MAYVGRSPQTAMPDDGKMYRWDEDTTAWVEVPE